MGAIQLENWLEGSRGKKDFVEVVGLGLFDKALLGWRKEHMMRVPLVAE